MARQQAQRGGAASRGRKPVRSQPGERRGAGAAVDRDAPTSYRPMGAGLTVQEIASDRLTKIAEANWSTAALSKKPLPKFQASIVDDIYSKELHGDKDEPPTLKRIMVLEISQFLENYLWPHFEAASASPQHVMAIAVMINEKFRENVPAWAGLTQPGKAGPSDRFVGFCQRFWKIRGERQLRMHERVSHLHFTLHMFQSLETEMVRGPALSLVSLPLWYALSEGRLNLERFKNERINKYWKHMVKKEKKAAAAADASFIPPHQRIEATFVPSLLDDFLQVLSSIVPDKSVEEAMEEGAPEKGGVDAQALLFCERFVEFLTDLLSQLPTRRFLRTLLEDRAILVKCRMAPLFQHPQGKLFQQLVDLLSFYLAFPMDDLSGASLTDADVTASHYEKVQQLQRLVFRHIPKLKSLALSNCGTVEKRAILSEHLSKLALPELQQLVTQQLRLVNEGDPMASSAHFLQEVMVSTYERRRFQTDIINDMPLYPTEAILWDENQVPSVHYTGETCLALPKLNLQFLDTTDYLLRNFNLFRLEATYEIREDIADALGRLGCTRDDEDNIVFKGWARMALPIVDFAVIEVQKPNVGEARPAAVTADIVINTAGLRGDVRSEWDEVKQHDVLFLMTMDPPEPSDIARLSEAGATPSPAERFGLTCVRGCEVLEVKDEAGGLMNDFTGRVKREDWKPPEGLKRTITVALDTAQYQMDMNQLQAIGAGAEDPYAGFNVLMRRKPKENNFKAVLESIRDLMNEVAIMPDWLEKVFLGYGDPAAAMYQNLPNQLRTIDFKDTFLDAQHVKESFPGHTMRFLNPQGQPTEELKCPFRVTFPAPPKPHTEGQKGVKRKRGEAAEAEDAAAPEAVPAAAASASTGPKSSQPQPQNGTAANGHAEDAMDADGTDPAEGSAAAEAEADSTQLTVQSYIPQDPGPYPQDKPPENTVRFTPVQVEAIKSGVNPGLTMVVGPPGTGKTDTAVQIMHVLYHNCPAQRTLLITHSNQALNDLFEKIMQRDVPARYLLRLGMGEQELRTEQDFSRVGRVNAMLERRIQLLAEVERMAKQFNVAEDMAYTCESAGYFWLLHVLSRWERFQSEAQRLKKAECVKELFPFKEYFADAPEQLFHGSSFAADMEKARGCFRHLRTMFQELEECRAFELLKGQADRVNYLMTKQAKIVAMTCTHAALKRREFLQLGFKYDNLLMEESAQILEIETFIPMLLQKQEDGLARLKRVILIGDHHQLPPVVKNMAFQKHSHLDQSLFTRFVRLGMPYLQLNAQGRARPSLASLYNWRYQELGDLPNVRQQPAYLQANAGLAYDYQFIDVPDYYLPHDPNPRGESEPVPHFYQNVGEAEYLVTWYQYMRLAGYPAEKISILTTYNGQKALLKDVIENRCAGHPAFGRPHKVATVDKYQGQQNDYILLSLVRTRAVGHIRDVRRLVVAMSRSRLGLYVFGRQALFSNCYELQPSLSQFLQRPTVPALHPTEHFQDAEKRPVGVPGQPMLMPSYQHMAQLVEQKRLEWEAATHNAAIAGITNARPAEEVYADEDDE